MAPSHHSNSCQSQDDSQWMPRIDRFTCTGCRACVDTCPTDALAQIDGKAALAYPERCIYCFACEDICPVDAIDLPLLICKKPVQSNLTHSKE